MHPRETGLKHTFMKCFKILRCKVLSFEVFSYLLSFNLSRFFLPCFNKLGLSCSLPFFLQDLYPFVLLPGWRSILPAVCECCSWELSGAKQSRIIAFPVLHTVVLLTGHKTTASFFSGTVTLLIPIQLMCLCSIPPQALSTLLFCIGATASPFQCTCVLLSQDTLRASILKAVTFPTLWRTRKAKFCFPRPPWNDVFSYHQADSVMSWLTADLRIHINIEVNWVGHSRMGYRWKKKMMKLVTEWISVRHKILSNLSKLVPWKEWTCVLI